MGKIDTMEWGEFHLYDIFSISMGNKFDRSKMCEVDEGINFVGRSALTNGVACAVTSVEDKKGNTVQPYPAGDITIALGGSIGAAFVQDREFYTSQNVCVLHTDDPSITERVKWFVAASITASCGNYEAFTDELNRHIRTDFTIRLPVDKTGQPDWAYMESYMANLETKVADSLTMLQAAKDVEKKKVDTREWGEFRVGELFEKLNLRFLPNRVFDKASDISEVKSEEFNLPLVNAKHSNNGIMYYGRKHEWEYEVLTIDIVADGAASTGDVYAQLQETGVLYNAYLVKPKAKCVTGLILFFLATVIQRCVKDHFGYDNKCTWDKVKHETILLPVDKTGQPDWAYMEEYMRKVEERVKKTINTFCVIRNIKFDC